MNPTTQAILLLTAHLDKHDAAKPLGPAEWGRLAAHLHRHQYTPADLLQRELPTLLDGWTDKTVSIDRLEKLLQRGSGLAIALEKWQRAGLCILTRADSDYPQRLKKHLGASAPPFFHAIGNLALANPPQALAVVGSRNADPADIKITADLATRAAQAHITITSGGARGVDEAAMRAALDAGGYSVGILADSLLRASTDRKWRTALQAGQLLLLTTCHPEAAFNSGNAMARNRYIYTMSDAAAVIHAGPKGGTISGAGENLKHHWVPLWVKPSDDPTAANATLVAQGGHWLPADGDISALLATTASSQSSLPIESPPDNTASVAAETVAAETPQDSASTQTELPGTPPAAEKTEKKPRRRNKKSAPELITTFTLPDLYQTFLAALPKDAEFGHTALLTQLKTLGIRRVQLLDWLKRAVAENTLERKERPVRYRFTEPDLPLTKNA
ncbi:DNA-processing protein DprA [Cardiobacterium valvarum]|uniref:Smf/DprA SLOG domain-containing protein n=1 Tax=Cardiobacterium valvarum F0432 TaxID=797473 RepID=G9ZC74_9GAMM|nr:DNA-processing protein DprA [Cardiobacterium valvarum]EHM55847.1 hypothetical protein HMPREF9080_00356 [Cardiobacterium valvarum F0432]